MSDHEYVDGVMRPKLKRETFAPLPRQPSGVFVRWPTQHERNERKLASNEIGKALLVFLAAFWAAVGVLWWLR